MKITTSLILLVLSGVFQVQATDGSSISSPSVPSVPSATTAKSGPKSRIIPIVKQGQKAESKAGSKNGKTETKPTAKPELKGSAVPGSEVSVLKAADTSEMKKATNVINTTGP